MIIKVRLNIGFKMKKIIDVADLDCIFLTYDEPKKEEFWVEIQNMVPWAKRVDGVKGSDAAHKAAADASNTDYFVLIDGDNMPDAEFFNLQLTLDDVEDKGKAFRWKARNHINGLMYGNGGMSCWSKEFVYNMKTHEASNGSADTAVEFCFDPKYIPMHNCYSTTYPNATPFQAWRAGFREGVKMCLDRGVKPSLKEFENKVKGRNFDHLCIWQSVGADVENGQYAIWGARQGTYMTMLTDWDFREVQWFDALKDIWEDQFKYSLTLGDRLSDYQCEVWNGLQQRLSMPIVELDHDQSKFFKHHYATGHKNLSLMATEMSVIRQVEGW
jgi:hypothetical protein